MPTDGAATDADAPTDARDSANDVGVAPKDAGDATIDGSHPPTEVADAPTDAGDASTETGDTAIDAVDDATDAVDDATDAVDDATDAVDDATDAVDAVADSTVDGSPGMIDGGDDGGGGDAGWTPTPPPSGMCTSSAVSVACPEPAGHPGCTEIFCGGRLWQNGVESHDGLITYRIEDPTGKFSDSYKSAIRGGAQAWSDASEGLVRFRECPACSGRVVVVVPGASDGIADPAAPFEQVLPMPVNAAAPPPLHKIAHQWGHVIGLGHTYERADRDHYVKFDPAVWCGLERSGLPPRCAFGLGQPGLPRVPSDTFGVYDEKSKMNGFAIDGICGRTEPDSTSGLPTDADGSAVEELYLGHTAGWAPFQPIARSVSPTEPLDYQLAPGVDPVGSPAITEWTPPAVEIFARGTDGAVYEVHNELFGSVFLRWSDWQAVATDVDADPAAVFVDANTLRLAVRARSDGSIRLRTRTAGNWGAWVSLGAPAVGAVSAPAIAAFGQSVSVVVLGKDGLMYVLTCGDPATTCAASSGGSDAWSALLAPPPGTNIISNPSAVFLGDGRLIVTSVSDDATARLVALDSTGVRSDDTNTIWQTLPHITLMPDDPNPGVAVVGAGLGVGFYARGMTGRLIYAERWYLRFNLGGVLASPPAVTLPLDGSPWVHIAAVIEDHGRPGVWVKFYGGADAFRAPCNLNAPGTCAECGCNVRNKPACEL